MIVWFKRNSSLVWSWAALIAGAAIIFWASRGTQYAQLGIGLLTASIALLVLVAAFEILCSAVAQWEQSPRKPR